MGYFSSTSPLPLTPLVPFHPTPAPLRPILLVEFSLKVVNNNDNYNDDNDNNHDDDNDDDNANNNNIFIIMIIIS